MSVDDLDRWIEGTLDDDRRAVLERHVGTGCAACALLAADARAFAGALEGRLSTAETNGAAADRRAVRAAVTARRAAAGRDRRSAWSLLAASLLAAAAIAVWTPPAPAPRVEVEVVLPGGADYRADVLPYSPPPVVRGEADPTVLWRAAGEAYRDGRYLEAARRFAEVRRADPEASDAALYQGVAWLAVGREREALEALEDGRARARAIGASPAPFRWYEALARLQLGETERAAEALAAVVAEGGPFAPEAAELLRRWSEHASIGPQ